MVKIILDDSKNKYNISVKYRILRICEQAQLEHLFGSSKYINNNLNLYWNPIFLGRLRDFLFNW